MLHLLGETDNAVRKYHFSGVVVLSKLGNNLRITFTTYNQNRTSIYWSVPNSVCVYSNSRNDVPRVAQRYGTITAQTRRRAFVLVVVVMFCVHMHSFAGLIRRTPPPTFSDTAITDRHSDTTIFQLRAHWVRISLSIGSENHSDMCSRWESNPRLPACKSGTLSTKSGSPHLIKAQISRLFIVHHTVVRFQLVSIS